MTYGDVHRTLAAEGQLYVQEFRRHQRWVQAHLKGDDGHPLRPSLFLPSSYWSSSEKELFFHALIIHSRLRPDLISEEIKTKSTLDVCSYLEALEAASASVPALEHVNSSLPIAFDVSEDWITREEDIACHLVDFENIANPQAEGSLRTSSPLFAEASQPRPPGSMAALNHLDSTCLMVMEGMLREVEANMVHLDTPEGASPPSPSAKASPPPDSEEQPQEDDSLSRRRLQKRLYMRKKRAESSGKRTSSVYTKLRPGRQTRPRKPPKPRPTTYKRHTRVSADPLSSSANTTEPPLVGFNLDEELDEMDLEYELRSKGGANRRYRVKKDLENNGINAQSIADIDLDFFHLSTLARLIRLFNSLNDEGRPLDRVGISADTIKILISIVTEFTNDLIRRAIISKEQEIRLKGTLKVWKHDFSELSAENIIQSLHTMGLAHMNKEEYFAHLIGDSEVDGEYPLSGVSEESEGLESDEGELLREVKNMTDRNGSDDTELHVQYRQQHLFTLPPSLQCSLPYYRLLFDNDCILPPEVDQQEFEDDMKAEQELDFRDSLEAQEYEKKLWGNDSVFR